MADTLNNRIVGVIEDWFSSIENPTNQVPDSIGSDLSVFQPGPMDIDNPIRDLTHVFDVQNYPYICLNRMLSQIDNTRISEMSFAAVTFTINVVDLYIQQQNGETLAQSQNLHLHIIKSALKKSLEYVYLQLNAKEREIESAAEDQDPTEPNLRVVYQIIKLTFDKLYEQAKVLWPDIIQQFQPKRQAGEL
jgi:hypothetical protein